MFYCVVSYFAEANEEMRVGYEVQLLYVRAPFVHVYISGYSIKIGGKRNAISPSPAAAATTSRDVVEEWRRAKVYHVSKK